MLDFNFKVPKYVKRRQVILEIRMVQFGSVRCSVRPYFSVVRFGSAEPLKRQFGRSLVYVRVKQNRFLGCLDFRLSELT